jgi:DNA-binding GntR family transcriptional regulator
LLHAALDGRLRIVYNPDTRTFHQFAESDMPSAPSRARKQPARVHPVALRGAVREAIFERILSSRLTPGSSVGEVALGKALGASRTPLREALIELQAEGLIEHDPGRGFIVPPLSAQELREVYPIIA